MDSLDSVLSPLVFLDQKPQKEKGEYERKYILTLFVLMNNSDPHFLRVPCWKITLFVIVPVLGPLVALIICYNWLHRRLAGEVVGRRQ